MNYAVIKSGGKQHIVKPNESFVTDRMDGNPGDAVLFDEVLLVVNDSNVSVGSPFVSGYQVKGKIVDQMRGDKIRVGKYKSKSRYHKVRGFKSMLTEVMIESIKAKGDK